MRVIWFSGGLLALGTGFIGIFVPLLPTVPFLLLCAFCFAKSSETWHRWLLDHPTFGPPILDWRRSGAIRRPAKMLATISVSVAFGISLSLGVAAYALVIQALVLIGVLTFIWSRPEG